VHAFIVLTLFGDRKIVGLVQNCAADIGGSDLTGVLYVLLSKSFTVSVICCYCEVQDGLTFCCWHPLVFRSLAIKTTDGVVYVMKSQSRALEIQLNVFT